MGQRYIVCPRFLGSWNTLPFFSGLLDLSEESTTSDFEDTEQLSDSPDTLCHRCNPQWQKDYSKL